MSVLIQRVLPATKYAVFAVETITGTSFLIGTFKTQLEAESCALLDAPGRRALTIVVAEILTELTEHGLKKAS